MAEQDTILLVDDNPTNLEVLYQTLDKRGYRLLVARDGQAALKIVKEVEPTLVLLDVMMPGMDGFEVCALIKADPATANVAVIFLSALGDAESKVRGFELGGVDYVSKPFQADEIVMRVATHIRIRRLESELAQRNLELESEIERILSSMTEGVYGVDLEGNITYANKAAGRLTGWREEELIGREIYAIHSEPDSDRWLTALDFEGLAEGRSVEWDHKCLRRKDGSFFDAALNLTPSVLNGKLEAAVLVFRDITARLENEEALAQARTQLAQQQLHLAHIERLSTMGEMAAGFAHEVNQPLTAIANYASVARRLLDAPAIDTEKLKSVFGKLQNQAIRASDVIQRLRNFVRTPKGGKSRRAPNELMKEVIELAEVDSRRNNVLIRFKTTPGLPLVMVDDVQLQQVALNLLRNGMESMVEAGNTRPGVEVVLSGQSKMVRFAVKDYGGGLAPDAEDHLFHPFYTTKANGMGIGLSVCASIVQEHGGKMGYERNPEGGTTFYFELPACT
ncbi:MAG: response regulator [Pseudomonadales bacterium]